MSSALVPLLRRIADALERAYPPHDVPLPDLKNVTACLWRPHQRAHQGKRQGGFITPRLYRPVPLNLLQGIDTQRDQLLANTQAFALGKPANNALLWGAKGMGKSSLVKSIIHHINQQKKTAGSLLLIDVQQNDMPLLTPLLESLADTPRRCVLFCDDLAFDTQDVNDNQAYHALKAMLEGSISEKPDNVVIYATSNQRHLTSRHADDSLLHEKDARDDKISLSDRFGLWLGFHACSPQQWYAILDAYRQHDSLPIDKQTLYQQADLWAQARGGRSGRVASQFITHIKAQ